MHNNVSVLVIEDDSAWQKIIVANLKLFDCTITACVGNTDEALLAIEQQKFDIALIDIYLHGKSSGIALGKLARQTFNKPFIFLTSSIDPKLFGAAVSANPSAYLTKPFSPESLYVTVKSAIQHFNNPTSHSTKIYHIETKHDFIFVKAGNNLKKIMWSAVLCLRSDKNYTAIITSDSEAYMIRCSLQKTLSMIIPNHQRQNFVQINRAEVLQLSYIDLLIGNEAKVCDQTFTVTDAFSKNLRHQLHVIL